MEFTFTQETAYSFEPDGKKLKELAAKLGITVANLQRMATDGELYDEHGDEILAWLTDQASSWETVSDEDIDNLEIHA